jgi:hypothetical protein
LAKSLGKDRIVKFAAVELEIGSDPAVQSRGKNFMIRHIVAASIAALISATPVISLAQAASAPAPSAPAATSSYGDTQSTPAKTKANKKAKKVKAAKKTSTKKAKTTN